MDYATFIGEKVKSVAPLGFEPDSTLFPSQMQGFQVEATAWAVRLGRAALLLDTGRGKTLCQLVWSRCVALHTGRPVLMLTPLAVGPQTIAEAVKFGIPDVYLAEHQRDVSGPGIYVTNYQKLHHFDREQFGGIALDEASILKSFMGQTKQALVQFAEVIPYRLASTATPAPNDYLELGNLSEFLGIMHGTEMIMRWFCNDQAQAGHYRLKKHAEADYWRWLASWACCVSKPSDLGYPDDGYDLPELRVIEHVTGVEHMDAVEVWTRSEKATATTIHRGMRQTAVVRARKVAELVAAEPDESWLIWCNTDYEADALQEAIPHATDVRGSMPDKRKVDGLMGFAEGRIKILISKPKLAGYGLNWQHCSRMAFVGVSYSWEMFYQAVRRCWRFGQLRPVDAHVICAETETEILDVLKRKQAENDEMRLKMSEAVKESWRDQNQRRKLAMSYKNVVEQGDGWELRLGDCCQEIKALADESIDFSIFSPPFKNLYIYSDSAYDMGNSDDDAEFFRHFKYLIPELLRVTVPGRLCAVHCKDLPLYMNRDGASGLQDFPGEISRAFVECGWTFHSRVTIWKCPVTERERTNNHGLLHMTVVADSTRVRQGMADYLMVFRKTPETGTKSVKPVERPEGFTEWPGDPHFDPRKTQFHPSKFARKPKPSPRWVTLPDGRVVDHNPSVMIWQRLADPVWWHIDQQDVLNYDLARSDKDEKHICPLQLGVVREAVSLWTNPGDVVLSPFAGIGSEGYESVRLGRQFVGVELKRNYFDVAVNNLREAETLAKQKDLFSEIA